jgi:hypothetical protein
MLNMGNGPYNAWDGIYNGIQNHTHRQWYELGVIFVIYYMFISFTICSFPHSCSTLQFLQLLSFNVLTH